MYFYGSLCFFIGIYLRFVPEQWNNVHDLFNLKHQVKFFDDLLNVIVR